MTNNNHPITPPDDLQEQWKQEWLSVRPSFTSFHEWMLAKSAQWIHEQRGASNEAELQKARDEELEACCEWIEGEIGAIDPKDLFTARRPKSPSLKEQALAVVENSEICDHLSIEHAAILRRALESLTD